MFLYYYFMTTTQILNTDSSKKNNKSFYIFIQFDSTYLVGYKYLLLSFLFDQISIKKLYKWRKNVHFERKGSDK